MDWSFISSIIFGAIIGVLAGLLCLSRQRERMYIIWCMALANIIIKNSKRSGAIWMSSQEQRLFSLITDELRKEVR